MQRKCDRRRPPCPVDYRENLLRTEESLMMSATAIDSSRNRLMELHRNYTSNAFKPVITEQKQNIQRKFQRLPVRRSEPSVTISQYLSLVHENKGNNVEHPPASNLKQQFKSKFKLPKRTPLGIFTHQTGRPSQKRVGVNRYLPKQYVTLAVSRIPESVNIVINLYQLFKQLGYSDSKIHTLVKNSCRGKKDVEGIFLSPDKHTYSRSSEQIYTRIKKMVLMSQERHVDQLVSEINDFRRILQEEFMNKGDHKIAELQSSIKNKIEKFQQFAAMDETDRNRLLARTQHKNIDRVMSSVYKAQLKLGSYDTISKVSRWFYQSLGRAQDRINYNLTKDRES